MLKYFFSSLFLVSNLSLSAADTAPVNKNNKCANILSLKATTIVENNSFETSRGLITEDLSEGYFQDFGDAFKRKLLSLSAKDHWIDLGAGDGLAIFQYYSKFDGRASTQGISYKETPGFIDEVEGKLPINSEYLSGRLFEEISQAELKPADIITDYFGVISYTKHLSLVLKKTLSALKTEGSLFIYQGSDKTRFSTSIYIKNYMPDGPIPSNKPQSIANFLRLIPGLDVLTHQVGKDTISVEIIKRADFKPDNIPNLVLIDYLEDGPPKRVFHTKAN